MAETYSIVYMGHMFLFIYVGHLRCPHVLAIVNSAAINIGAHVSFRITVFFRYVPRSGLAGADGVKEEKKRMLCQQMLLSWLETKPLAPDLDSNAIFHLRERGGAIPNSAHFQGLLS